MLAKKEQLPPDDKGTEFKIVRLWVHEMCRVFYDRISNETD